MLFGIQQHMAHTHIVVTNLFNLVDIYAQLRFLKHRRYF